MELDITPDSSLADLAATIAGASRVFARHRLDFCCHGRVPLAEACAKRRIAVDALIDEIRSSAATAPPLESWTGRTVHELVHHIVDHYHRPLREELPRLLAMAERVEKVHGDKPTCPTGLAQRLRRAKFDVEFHLEKEEQILFPLLCAGDSRHAVEPIAAIEGEHEEHGRTLEELRRITGDHRPPPEACGTWRALYLGLEQLERDLFEHIHLENHVLFPRAARLGSI